MLAQEIKQAAQKGAELVVLQELHNSLGRAGHLPERARGQPGRLRGSMGQMEHRLRMRGRCRVRTRHHHPPRRRRGVQGADRGGGVAWRSAST